MMQGEKIEQLQTPCLLLDKRKMMRNIERMKAHAAQAGIALRPHLKTAKSIDVALLAMSSPRGPATVSTLKEAEYFAGHGFTNLLYAVGIAPAKLGRVVEIRRKGCDLCVVLDSVEAAMAVAEASKNAGTRIPAMIEIDSDGHRSGVRAGDKSLLLAIGEALARGAELRGVMTHAGSSYGVEVGDAMQDKAREEQLAVLHSAEILRAAGLPCPVVSVGSTPSTIDPSIMEGITEIRAGVYMFFDLVMAGIGVCTLDDIAISVLATVIGHQRDKGWIITDAGWMAMSRDRGTAKQAVDQGYGVVVSVDGAPYPDLIVIDANQEHGIMALRPGSRAALPDLPLGSLIRVLPNHACATAAQYSEYAIIGGGGLVHERWRRINGW